MAEIFAVLSGLVVLAAGPPYLLDILHGKTKPQRTTWFIWAALSVIALVSQVQLGAHWSLLFAAMSAAGNLIVFLLSLKYGVGGWKREDAAGLMIAAAGTVLSMEAGRPLIALSGVILADAVGMALTLIKTYRMPSSETTIAWWFIGTSSLLGALSVGSWKFSLLLYPVYMAASSYAVLAVQLAGHIAQRKHSGAPSQASRWTAPPSS